MKKKEKITIDDIQKNIPFDTKLDDQGREINDPDPVLINLGLKKPKSLHERIKEALRSELARYQADQGQETLEDAEDFDIDDDFEFFIGDTKYTLLQEEYLEDRKSSDDEKHEKATDFSPSQEGKNPEDAAGEKIEATAADAAGEKLAAANNA